MPVHAQVQEIIDAELPPPGSIEEAREQYEAGCLTYVGPAEPVDSVSDEDADGVRVRVFTPKGGAGQPLPVVLWIHGGGWILGTIDAHDALCRALCNAAEAIVCSVDYRLAPEAQHPAQLEDCRKALAWVRAEFPDVPVAVAGDSAGGNLAAVLARHERDGLAFQLLVYPATDGTCSTPSYESCGDGSYALSRDEMRFCWEAYAPGEEAKRDPDVSPVRAPVEDLAGAPPALVICAQYDPLTDEALAYASRLREAGVQARTVVYDGMVHGFFRWRGGVDAAHEAMGEAAAALRAALGSERLSPLPAPAS
ncbi:MAG TPA: alpha/beta hydrolase [Solirubrobacteraceae bacterium]